MMWSVFILTISIVVKFISILLLLILSIPIGYRLWMEPFKGVCRCKTKLYGKVVVITGGNSGIGFETAKELARRGAKIIIASRNDKRSEEAVAIIKETTGNSDIEYRHLDLAKLDSIKEFVENLNNEFDRLDILVNNAGSAGVKFKRTENGIDLLMQINYIGSFMLTHLLQNKLIASKPSRIIVVSSYAHAFSYKFKVEHISKIWTKNKFYRYANTKLCGILWARELATRLPRGVTVNALHPGIVMTDIFHNFQPYIKKFVQIIILFLFKNATEGAQTVIHLCLCPEIENSTGGYYVDCKKIKPAKIANNDELARQVWERTLELIRQ